MKKNLNRVWRKLGKAVRSAYRHEWGIRSRLLLIVLIPATATALALTAYFISAQFEDLEDSLRTRARILINQLAKSISHYDMQKSLDRIYELSNTALSEDDVISIEVSSAKSPSLVDVSNPIDDKIRAAGNFTFRAAIVQTIKPRVSNNKRKRKNKKSQINPGKTVGWVSGTFSYKNTRERENILLLEAFFIAITGLFFSTLLALRMGKNVTEPLIRLTETVNDMAEGKLDTRVNEQSRGELGTLEQDINTMGSALQENQEYLTAKIDSATSQLRNALTEMELQNEELDKARQQALDTSLIKTEFLANMSHEIRTPLNGILGFTNILLKSHLSDTQQSQLETIQQSTQSLLTVINDTLDFSRIEAGDFRLENISIDIRENLEDSITLMTQQAYDKGLDLILMIYSDVPQRVDSDPVRIRQIVTNLVSNAIKYTEQGSITIRVMLEEAKSEYVTLKFSIQDTGKGIDKKDQKNLFDPYVQSRKPGKGSYSNIRLGLVICKKLVETMKGNIGFESQPDHGSTFWFTCQAAMDTGKKQDLRKINPLQQYNNLLFDSNELSRLAIVHQFTEWGMETTQTHDFKYVEKALKAKATNSSRYDLITISLSSDELESTLFPVFMKAIKNTKNPEIPILVLASTVNRSTLKNLLKQGATLAVPKTQRAHQLYNNIALLLTQNTALSNYHKDNNSNTTINDNKQNLNGLSILVVDDNKINRKLIQALLSEQGAKIFEASDGKKAVDIFSAQHIDFIVMDIQMPVMSGTEATRKIRSMEQGRQRTPIIALTAATLDGDQDRFVRAGFDGVLIKPIQDTKLYDIIDQWVTPRQVEPEVLENKENKPEPTVKNKKKIKDAVSVMFDRKLALRLTGGNMDLANELFFMLVEDLPNMKNVLNQSLNPLDCEKLENISHKIHGAASYCAVNVIKESADAVEKASRTKNERDIYKKVRQLNKDIDALLEEQVKASTTLSDS
ncbi:hypothetical protein MNBD_GAMMA12-1591 [hydrothermal vent metagenome]|uniref:histidine kinase n=1 Tax=hydrothermal vent metagenome TaxID=652676 RepID=A0A3B0Z368_9ZZZZ